MSKYNDLMNKVEVSAEMKSRILLNLEKELAKDAEAETVEETAEAVTEAAEEPTKEAESVAALNAMEEEYKKVADFKASQEALARKKALDSLKRFGVMAATFAVLFIGVAAVMRATGGRNMATTAPSYDSAMSETAAEAPMEAEATMEAAEPAYMDEAAEAPAAVAEAEPADNVQTVGSANSLMGADKAENSAGSAILADAEPQADVNADAEAENAMPVINAAPEAAAEPAAAPKRHLAGILVAAAIFAGLGFYLIWRRRK